MTDKENLMGCARLIVIFITVPVVFLIGLTALNGNLEVGSTDPANIALAIIIPFGLIVVFAVVVLGIAASSNRNAKDNLKKLLRSNGVREGSVEWKAVMTKYDQKR